MTPAGAFAVGVAGSAVVYMFTFVAVGVAPDFRFGYWAVLAAIAGGAALLVFSSEAGTGSRDENASKQ